jgi:phosphatidylserine/phosphatidylglycerophosphate/cardiolipin synthase-like enzyme
VTECRVGDSLGASLVESLGPDCSVAAVIARSLIAAGTSRTIDIGGLSGLGARPAERAVADFEARGWLVREGRRIVATSEIPSAIPSFLDGAAAMRRSLPHDGRAQAAVTMPATPSAIARVLPAMGLAHASLEPTAHALERIARGAAGSFTIMTPFLNREGLLVAIRLFETTRAPARRLVIRKAGSARAEIEAARGELERAGIEVLNYTLPAGDGYETFHAKVVIADENLAYVGSANMTFYARHSMELGIVVDGRPARVVSSIVRAIERIAVPMIRR